MTVTHSRRSMLAGLAAAPVLGLPALAAASDPATDNVNWTAVSDRLHQVLTLLRERYVCSGWKMDEASAAAAVSYVNDRMAGLPEDDESWSRFLAFVHKHGQSTDYILTGDASAMICSGAGLSPQAAGSPGDPIKGKAEALARDMAVCHGGSWRTHVDHEAGFILIRPRNLA